MAKILELSLIIWLSFSVFFGALIFSKGFLLNRQVIARKSELCLTNSPHLTDTNDNDSNSFHDESNLKIKSDVLSSMLDWCRFDKSGGDKLSTSFSKVILILVDALRFDFIPRMKFLSESISYENTDHPIFAHSFRFLADPPTTTMQRLKALMTGTMPTFIDASANFNSHEVEEDNFIFQLHAARKRIAFLGDDTWLNLFPKNLFTSPFVEAHPSFNAWDLDTVDSAVNASIHRILQSAEQTQWDVLIAHFLGVDHCGHRYGPRHPEMVRKLNEVDATLKNVFNAMTPDTLLVVFGDHGMTKSGDHGGDSIDEVESGLVFLSKVKTTIDLNNHSESETAAVSQIDLAPTLSTLIGLPIPFSSIGQIIPGLMDIKLYSDALAANVAQVSRYIDSYSNVSNLDSDNKSSLKKAYAKVEEAFRRKATESGRIEFCKQARDYLKLVKNVAVKTWTQFDFMSIYIGISLSLLPLVLLLIFVTAQLPRTIPLWILCTTSCTISSSGLIWFLIGRAESQVLVAAFLLIVFVSAGFVFKIQNFKRTKKSTKIQSELIEFSDLVAIIAYFFTCVAVFSNSFVINEGYVIGSTLLVVVLVQVLTSRIPRILIIDSPENSKFLWSLPRAVFKSAWVSFFFLAIILRVGNLFFRCREELVDCQEEFLLHKHLPSLPTDWVVPKYVRYGEALLSLAVLVVGFRHYMMTARCTASSRPASVISKYIPSFLVVLTCAYWALQGLPFGLPQIAQNRFLNYFPSVLQSITLLSMFIVWTRPICCIGRIRTIPPSPDVQDIENEQLNVSQLQPERQSEAVFSSTILTHSILVTLLSVQVSSAGYTPIITFIPYTIACLLNIASCPPRNKIGSWSSIISWTLASQYFFYATGHQAVFSTIPWDSAFIGTSDALGNVDDTWISWIRPALAVLGNLNVSQILFSMSLPLLVYWRDDVNGIPESLMGKRERRDVFVLGGKFILLHGIKCFFSRDIILVLALPSLINLLLFCICCVTLHRRHLMVWKIFAPKFIFEGVSFFILIIVVSGSLILVTHLDYLFQKILLHEKQYNTNS